MGIRDSLEEHERPRFVTYVFERVWKDQRVDYPIIFIHFAPHGCHPDLLFQYTRHSRAVQEKFQCTKTVEVKELAELTEETLNDAIKMKRYGQ
eukprot:NODE_3339_length_406_cov_531.764706_g2805_i0.p1 GENE.NODE_3339_length_406_cov_531.764706_g2805_i0~~NODE_3339_length_406_cov_531.764706_g2805_i0.p1  ORF type:complete len:101 (-),score=20.44 NODE_3339_length_406_cov_531.764706_g2805_i0:102-380(-)